MELHALIEALRHSGRTKSFRCGRSLHCQFAIIGGLTNVFIINNLMAMYLDFGYLEDARKLFDEMPERTVVTWTTMVCGFIKMGEPDDAIKLYTHMVDTRAATPNRFMFSAVLKACSLSDDLESGRSIHERIRGSSLDWDVAMMNSLLDMYIKCGSLADAQKVFDEMPLRNSTSWNTLVSGYGKEGLVEEAVNLFNMMQIRDIVSWNSIISGFSYVNNPEAIGYLSAMLKEGLKPDHYTLPCVLNVCGFHGLFNVGQQIHGLSLKSGLESCCFVQSALLDMYSSCGEVTEAVKLFVCFSGVGDVTQDNLVVWNSMVSAFFTSGEYSSALKMVSGIDTMDKFTFVTAFKSCMKLQNFRVGLQLHGLAVTTGYELDCFVGCVLVELYIEQGSIKSALGVFYRLPTKDIVAWCTLIAGFVDSGLHELGLVFFQNMIGLGTALDEYVISIALRACSSMTNLAMGKETHALNIKHGYTMDMIVLTSLIDMYSKCGAIDDALTLFRSSSVRDEVCWTGIIVGCGQNGRVHEARRLFYEMIESGSKPNALTFSGILSACRHTGMVAEALYVLQSMKADHGVEPCLEHYYCVVHLLGQAGYIEDAEKLVANMPFQPDEKIWTSLLVACGVDTNAELLDSFDRRLLEASCCNQSINVAVSNAYAAIGKWENAMQIRKRVGPGRTKEDGRSQIDIHVH